MSVIRLTIVPVVASLVAPWLLTTMAHAQEPVRPLSVDQHGAERQAVPIDQPSSAPDQPSDESAETLRDRFSFNITLDFASAYYFRGIPQENQGFIFQPYAGIGFKAFDGADWLKDVTFSVATWNSFQTGPTGSGGTHSSPEAWYESDILAGVSATLFDDFTGSVTYAAYTSPNDSYNTYQEIMLKLAWNDSKCLGKWALNPYVLLAFEFDDQADGGNTAFNPIAPTNEGIYLELGIAPSLPIIESESSPVSLIFPVTAGFSLEDYYENGAGQGGGSAFGFVDIGTELSLPLQSMMPSDSSAWSLRAGPHFIWLGDDAAALGQAITGGDHFDVWWKLSIGWTF